MLKSSLRFTFFFALTAARGCVSSAWDSAKHSEAALRAGVGPRARIDRTLRQGSARVVTSSHGGRRRDAKLLVILGLLLLFVLTGCATPSVTMSGHMAADGRAFAYAPKYAGQADGHGVSLVAEPQVEVKSQDEKQTLTARPFYRLDPIDGKRSHADIRQASYKLALDHLEAQAGVGQLTWGALESYRPTDVLNQVDFVETPAGTAKLGQPFAEVGWIGQTHSLRLYYFPYFRDRTFPGARGRLRFPVLIDTASPSYESKLGVWHPSGALRWAFTIGDFDFGIGAFTGLSREPRFVAQLTTGNVVPRYDLLHQGSADTQWTLGPVVLKAEMFTRIWGESRRVYVGGGAGAEYTFSKLIGDWDLGLAGEMLWDTRPVDAPPTFFEHDAFGGLRLAFNDASSTEVLGGAIVDIFDGTTFARLEAGRRFGDHWKATLSANAFVGRSGKLESAFLKDDHLLGRIAYHF